MGARAKGLTDTQSGAKGIEAVEHLSRKIGVPKKVKGHPLTDESLDRMVANAMKDGLRLFGPRQASEEEIRELFRQIF